MYLCYEIVELFDLFKKNGYQLYIIGGAVRDFLLNREIDDYDFTTDATPDELIELLKDYKLDTYQKELGSVKIHLNNKNYELTTFRKEYGVKNLRYPKRIEFVKNLAEDVLRRDFTFNTIAYSPSEGIVDLVNGLNDLKNKKIKFVKDTQESINEDPIRLIRALRFSLLLKFNICETDLKIFKNNLIKVFNLGKIKYDELFKLFKIKGCKVFIKKYFDIYKVIYPEINNEKFINALSSNIEEEKLKYIFMYCSFNTKIDLTKKDKLIIKGLREIDLNRIDLYYTKLLMIEYQDNLVNIIELLKSMGSNISQIEANILIIKNEKHCLSLKDLSLTYLDLDSLNQNRVFIDKKDYHKVLKYLLDCVLKDNSLNEKEKLIKIIKGD